jgi:large subunit ribosomal protein L32
MPLPKRRHSNKRTRLRRTHYKLTLPLVGECPQCHSPRRAHHACPACGFYNGRKAIAVKSAKAS